MATAVRLASPLPPPECRARLEAALASPWRLRRDGPVYGRLRGERFWAVKRINGRNSFQTRLVAELSPSGTGTAILCRFGMHPFVVGFMVLWFGGVLSGVAGTALLWLTGEVPTPSGSDALALLVPAGMGLFGLGLLRFGRWIARDEQRFLLAWLHDTVWAVPR